tara:strand:- start:8885 stop:9430 length:546 start_codon:yes stop_codon:yes gene_type:complete
MDPTTIETTETAKQLDGDLQSAFRKYHGVRRGYFKKNNPEKIEPQEEVLKFLYIIEALAKQLSAKIASHSRAIAREVSTKIFHNPVGNAELFGKFYELDQSLARLQKHSSVGVTTSNALRHMVRNARLSVRATADQANAKLEESRRHQQLIQQQASRSKRKQSNITKKRVNQSRQQKSKAA